VRGPYIEAVSTNGERRQPRRLDAEFGRAASRAELRRFLLGAPPSFLEGAVDNPVTGEEEIALLLRNRSASPALLIRVGRDRRWNASYGTRKGIARHRQTPAMLARGLLHHLHWADLSDLAEDTTVSVAVRRHAETLVRTRLPEMALGERIALARRAGRELIGALLRSTDGRVLAALLGNPKLTDRDAEEMARRPDAPPNALRRLSDHPRWGSLLAVRAALARNPRSPIPVALRWVARLPLSELDAVIEDERAPKIVRISADRRRGETLAASRSQDGSG
jgi:hypothetical protein